FTSHLFSNSACDASGFGEGQMLVGTVSASSDGSGNATFSQSGLSLPIGRYVTATATDLSNNTSEFSACTAVALATGLSSPANGVVYRPATNDLLVTEFGGGKVSKVSVTDGNVSQFAVVSQPDELAVGPGGDVFVEEH